MKKRKLLKQSKKLVAVVTAVALLDAPAAYAADGATSETAQYHAEESFDSVSDVSEYAETESQVQQTEEESIQTESITETEAAEEEVTTEKATVGETETATETGEAAVQTADAAVQTVTNGWDEDGHYYENGEMVKDREIEYYTQDENGYLRSTYARVDAEGNRLYNEWYQDGDDWYYYGSDGNAADGLLDVNGDTYYFGYKGYMYKDTTCGFHNDDGKYCQIRVNEIGHVVKGWYTTEWGARYYYDPDTGIQVIGIKEIDGNIYYFNDAMCTDRTVVVDGVIYYFGEDGAMVESQNIEQDGWFDFRDHTYYARNKDIVKEEFITEGDDTYYVGWDGAMCIGQFSHYDSESGKPNYYCADEDGRLIKGWYTDEWEDQYYYDPDTGIQAIGIKEIDGDTYYFNNSMQKNCVASQDGKLYFFGEDGKLTKTLAIEKDGWIQNGDTWYYIKDGELVKNDFITDPDTGYTYFMGGDGTMFVNQTFSRYDSEDGQENCYRVDQYGHLVKGWYKVKEDYDENVYWYYYDDNGLAVRGIQEINGTTYDFDYDGRMMTDEVVIEDGTWYYFDQDGVLADKRDDIQDGWNQMNNQWYYVKDQSLVINDFITDKGYTYYMNGKGIMLTDEEFDAYNNDSGELNYYRVDQYGHLLKNSWYSANDERYYYGEDGVKANGLQNINGTYYYFNGNGMCTDCVIVDDGIFYYFDEDGACNVKQSLDQDDWIYAGSRWYYAKDQELVTESTMTIRGVRYLFDSNGQMVTNDSCFAYPDGDKEQIGHYYRADENGHIVTGWYEEAKGSKYDYDSNGWFYYAEDGHAEDGVVTIDGKLYYLSEGRMLCDKKHYQDGKLYVFGSDGVGAIYTQNGWVDDKYYIENGETVTGFKEISGKWYYFGKNGEKAVSTTREVEGKSYYFNSKGEMMTGLFRTSDFLIYADASGHLLDSGWYQHTDGNWYYFNNAHAVSGIVEINDVYNLFKRDGTWVRALGSDENGWLSDADGNWYYLEKGVPVMNDTREIDGNTYSFDNDGIMEKNTYGWNEGNYNIYYTSSGAMLKNGWVEKEPGIFSYYDEEGLRVRDGWKKINGQWYYFDNEIMNNQDKIIDGKLYHFASSGVSDYIGIDMADGWNLVAGRWYYVQNQTLVTNKIVTINGQSYYFDGSGKMLYNQIMMLQGVLYYFDQNGVKTMNGWCNNGNSYAENGVLYTGQHTINGKKYWFSDEGELYRENQLSEDKKTVTIIDEDGVIQKTVTAQQDGWVHTSDGNWYYVRKGTFVYNRLLQINGVEYYFDYEGMMLTNGYAWGIGYADADGVITTTGWVGSTYINEGFKLEKTTYVIDGKYYLLTDGASVTGIDWMDGAYYYFDGQGNRTAVNLKAGWNKIHNGWYYVDTDGTLVNDSFKQIGNTFYSFDDATGKMLTNSMHDVYMDGMHLVYFGADGTPVRNCWKTISGKKYYFDANGWTVTGTQTINGKTYIFDTIGCLIQ